MYKYIFKSYFNIWYYIDTSIEHRQSSESCLIWNLHLRWFIPEFPGKKLFSGRLVKVRTWQINEINRLIILIRLIMDPG